MTEPDPKRPLEPTLDAYRRLVDSVPSGPSQERVHRRLQASLRTAEITRPRRHTVRWLAPALAVTAMLVVLASRWLATSARAPQVVTGFTIDEADGLEYQIGVDSTVVVTAGHATLVDSEIAIDVAVGTQLRREQLGVRLVRGRVRVTARHRSPTEAPARVLVSRGRIEVMGTRFSVIERGDAGEVTLEQGAIRFVAVDGRFVTLSPGQSYRWPEPLVRPAPTPNHDVVRSISPASAEPARASSRGAPPSPAVNVEQLLDDVSTLRDQRQYEAAIDAIEQALRGEVADATRERLTYEAGTILTEQLGDPARACRFWADHRSLFSHGGRYTQEVEAARRKLGCSSPKPSPEP